MTMDQPTSDFFTAGGTLPPDAPSYVKRSTDDELFSHIISGEFCYILTPRQMGKSSLMIRTVQRLFNMGMKSAIVDLAQIGTDNNEDQWYKGILTQIRRRLKLSVDPAIWWEKREDIPNIQKFIGFFEEVLNEVKDRVVIFIDEIDTTLKLEFRDDFFAGIRAIFNARAENSSLNRITFVLLGVASPSDLIKDRTRTPFNIGHEILLKSFSRQNAVLLENGLDNAYPGSGKKILDRIFYWTNGHPYLTQKLCQIIVEQNLRKNSVHEIDKIVKKNFLSEEASRETNIQFVADNILKHQSKRSLLKFYNRLLNGEKISERKNSLEQIQLKLSGLISAENQTLIISNEIYREVFDIAWVKKNTDIDKQLILTRSAFVVILIILFSFVYIVIKDSQYNGKLANESQRCFSRDPNPDKRLGCLADLFQPDVVIIHNDFSFMARDLFFSQTSWTKQQSIFAHDPNPEDLKVVIEGLYTNLADVDKSRQPDKLLEMMHTALICAGLENSNLNKEIQFWLMAKESTGKELPSTEDYTNARDYYTQAISLNSQNPATLFERARMHVLLGDFGKALDDYEEVIAISPKEDEPIPAPIATSTVTPTATSTSAPTLTPTLTRLM